MLSKHDHTLPPKDAKSKRDDPNLIDTRRKALNEWLQVILANPKTHEFDYLYAFIEPVQMGDIRANK